MGCDVGDSGRDGVDSLREPVMSNDHRVSGVDPLLFFPLQPLLLREISLERKLVVSLHLPLDHLIH